jgi:hypothetical protein
MKFIKKIILGISLGAGILVILALIVSMLLISLVGSDYLKVKIIEQISQKTGHQIKLQSADIQLFPLLHAEMRHASLSIPGSFTISVANIKAYPEILPLFKGDVLVNKLYLDNPSVKVFMNERPEEDIKFFEKATYEEIEKTLGIIFSNKVIEDTNIAFQIRNGKVSLYKADKLYFEFDNIASNVKLKPGSVAMALTGVSNFCEKISFSGKIFPKTSTGEGRIDLSNFNPKIIIDYFYPNSDLKIKDSFQ